MTRLCELPKHLDRNLMFYDLKRSRHDCRDCRQVHLVDDNDIKFT